MAFEYGIHVTYRHAEPGNLLCRDSCAAGVQALCLKMPAMLDYPQVPVLRGCAAHDPRLYTLFRDLPVSSILQGLEARSRLQCMAV